MKRFFAFGFLMLLLLSACPGQAENRFSRHAKRDRESGERIYYYVYEAKELGAGMPLVIYLHGSGERGDDALANSLPLYVRDGSALCQEAILLVPQLPTVFGWWSFVEETLMEIINEVIETYQVDESRVALTGYSMGGLEVWSLAAHYPGRFTRVMPVSGRISEEIYIDAFEMCQLKNFVGSRDTTVDPKSSIEFTKALIDAGLDAELIELNATHPQMPARVYKDEEVLAWLWMEKGIEKN